MVICQASPKYHTPSTQHEVEPSLLQPDTSITLFHMKCDKNPLTKLDPVSVYPIRNEETHSGLILFFPLAPRTQPSPNSAAFAS